VLLAPEVAHAQRPVAGPDRDEIARVVRPVDLHPEVAAAADLAVDVAGEHREHADPGIRWPSGGRGEEGGDAFRSGEEPLGGFTVPGRALGRSLGRCPGGPAGGQPRVAGDLAAVHPWPEPGEGDVRVL